MKITLKEGWISLHIVYSHGGEEWRFYKEEPEYVEETYLAADPGECVPGKLIRILYCEADAAEVE